MTTAAGSTNQAACRASLANSATRRMKAPDVGPATASTACTSSGNRNATTAATTSASASRRPPPSASTRASASSGAVTS